MRRGSGSCTSGWALFTGPPGRVFRRHDERTGDLSWAVAGVNLRSAHSGELARLRSGGGAYVVKSYAPDGGSEFRLVRAHKATLRLVAMRGKGRGHRRRFRGPAAVGNGHRKRLLPWRRRRARSRQPRDQRRARRRREELDLRLSPGGARETPRGGRAAPDGPLLRQPARERCDAGAQPRALPGPRPESRRWPRGFPTTCRSPCSMVDRITPARSRSTRGRWPNDSASPMTSRSIASVSYSG